jgi:hypothetical protein
MEESTQLQYPFLDFKSRLIYSFSNLIDQIVTTIVYSYISRDTNMIDNEELTNKLKAAIIYAILILAVTHGYSINKNEREEAKDIKNRFKEVFNLINSERALPANKILDICYILAQSVNIFIKYEGQPLSPNNYRIRYGI